jgi:transcriptional regulator with XRE-family HTH domain
MPINLRNGVVLASLRAWRLHRVLSQDELAARARVARGTIQRAEHGLPVKVTTAARLARALRIPREALLSLASLDKEESTT